jgi:His/Glu/Gln/Arg/opine family amino acid ABC transporter permease subunit
LGSSGYQWDWGVVFNHHTLESFAVGIGITILVSALGLCIGIALGLITAIPRAAQVPVLSQLVHIYVDFFRTTPILVQLIWIFYVLPILLGINLSAFLAGSLTIGLNSGAFLSEIFRAGVVSVSQGQRDAAQMIGLSKAQALLYVVLPQALRRVLPALVNVFISVVKDSSLVSIIAVADITYRAESAVALTYRPFEFYTALAVLYFILTYPFSFLSSAIERRFHVA